MRKLKSKSKASCSLSPGATGETLSGGASVRNLTPLAKFIEACIRYEEHAGDTRRPDGLLTRVLTVFVDVKSENHVALNCFHQVAAFGDINMAEWTQWTNLRRQRSRWFAALAKADARFLGIISSVSTNVQTAPLVTIIKERFDGLPRPFAFKRDAPAVKAKFIKIKETPGGSSTPSPREPFPFVETPPVQWSGNDKTASAQTVAVNAGSSYLGRDASSAVTPHHLWNRDPITCPHTEYLHRGPGERDHSEVPVIHQSIFDDVPPDMCEVAHIGTCEVAHANFSYCGLSSSVSCGSELNDLVFRG
jgi:hypothetical protein